ncbi:hypothetical protein RHSIM_Rhsim02G0055300 [Rhododendron simsii]|uniref:F-box associated domain-containing protein n=1 Tax=Rhododendron simsii TaxID=118357 RepID=A0A834HAM3_RHOSS|nr:hypothetical protein RHSIM_Rhsim02G0055300 [Rhododendron simsii]
MNNYYAHHRLLISGLSPRDGVKSCSLYSILNEDSDTAVELDCPLKVPPRMTFGLTAKAHLNLASMITDYTHNRLLLLSPFGHDYAVKSCSLYAVCKSILILPQACFIKYYFGYEESIDDYKAVAFFHNVGTSGFDVEVKIYTLKTNSWRSIVDFLIVYLQVVQEYDTFGEVLQHNYRDGHSQMALHVVSGCLCVVCDYDGTYAEV